MPEDHPNLDPWTPWTVDLPPNYREPLIGLCLTTPGEVEKHVWRDDEGKYWVMEWKPGERTRRWAPITEATAQALCQPVANYWGKAHWLSLFAPRGKASAISLGNGLYHAAGETIKLENAEDTVLAALIELGGRCDERRADQQGWSRQCACCAAAHRQEVSGAG